MLGLWEQKEGLSGELSNLPNSNVARQSASAWKSSRTNVIKEFDGMRGRWPGTHRARGLTGSVALPASHTSVVSAFVLRGVLLSSLAY